MESKKGIKIAQLEEMNAQAGFWIGAYNLAISKPVAAKPVPKSSTFPIDSLDWTSRKAAPIRIPYISWMS